jgi:hypothetical protein
MVSISRLLREMLGSRRKEVTAGGGNCIMRSFMISIPQQI